MAQLGTLLTLALFLQDAVRLDALQNGLWTLPLGLSILVGAMAGGRLVRPIGIPGVVRAGLVIQLFGIGYLALQMHPGVTFLGLLPGLVGYGLGNGMATSQITNVVLCEIPVDKSGVASGTNSTIRQVGSALGIAIIGTLVTTVTVRHARWTALAAAPGLPGAVRRARIGAGPRPGHRLPAHRRGPRRRSARAHRHRVGRGRAHVPPLLFSLAVVAVGAVMTFFIPSDIESPVPRGRRAGRRPRVTRPHRRRARAGRAPVRARVDHRGPIPRPRSDDDDHDRGSGEPAPLYADPGVHARRWWTLAVLCLSLLIVFVGNSSLNVAIPTLSRELDATELAAAVGRRRLLARVRRAAVHHRRARRPLRPQGRAAVRARRLPRRRASLAVAVDRRCGSSSPAGPLMGVGAAFIMPSTLSILVNVFPPARAHEGDRDLGRRHRRRRRDRPGRERLAARPLLVRLGVPRQRADHRRRARRRLVPRARSRGIPRRRALDPLGAVLSIVGIVALVYGLIEAPEQRLGAAPRRSPRSRIGVVVLAAVRALGAAHRRADARHALLPQPGVQHRHRRDDPRVPGDVRRDVPDHAVLPARPRLQPARRRAAAAADGADHDHRRAAHAAAQRPLRRQPHRRRRHGCSSLSACCCSAASSVDTPYWLRPRLRARRSSTRHRADDVADDRGDHVGGAAAAGRRRLGDERRHPRARRRARHRGAGQHRRVAVHAPRRAA